VVKKAMNKALLSVEANGVSPADAWTAGQQAVTQQVG
jgi:hypothetical protein